MARPNPSWAGVALSPVLAVFLAQFTWAQIPPPPSFPAPVPQPEAVAATNPDADPDGSIVPLDEGPVHEAFAEIAALDERNGMLAPKAPPAPINEIPPEYRPEGNRVEWFPGYWMWSDDINDFIWISGVYRDVPPGQQFVPGYWSETPEGWRWVSGFWTADSEQELAYLPPPPAPLSTAPSYPQPGSNYFWVPGGWQYQSTGYAWQPGFWNPGYANWVWIPNRYRWTPRGYVYLRGYWDYPLVNRGLLFAPIGFARPIYRLAGFRYIPYRFINTSILLSRLFLAPSRGHYYFGNYGGSRYSALGYQPWINVGGIRGGYDPFYAYHYWNSRSNPNWLNNYRNDFAALTHRSANNLPLNLAARQASGPNSFSHDLVRDLRDASNHHQFAHLSDAQRTTANALASSRVTAMNSIRDQRAQVEHLGQTLHHNASSVGRNLSGGPDGIGPNSANVRNQVNNLANSGNHSSFRIPDSARQILNQHSPGSITLPQAGSSTRSINPGQGTSVPGTGRHLPGGNISPNPGVSNRLPGNSPPGNNVSGGRTATGNQPNLIFRSQSDGLPGGSSQRGSGNPTTSVPTPRNVVPTPRNVVPTPSTRSITPSTGPRVMNSAPQVHVPSNSGVPRSFNSGPSVQSFQNRPGGSLPSVQSRSGGSFQGGGSFNGGNHFGGGSSHMGGGRHFGGGGHMGGGGGHRGR